MSELLILEFAGVGQEVYDAVNAQLGIDTSSPSDPGWPAGLKSHAAGVSDSGSLLVSEVWDSREAQAAFMEGALGAALQAGGAPAPSQVTWTTLVVDTHI